MAAGVSAGSASACSPDRRGQDRPSCPAVANHAALLHCHVRRAPLSRPRTGRLKLAGVRPARSRGRLDRRARLPSRPMQDQAGWVRRSAQTPRRASTAGSPKAVKYSQAVGSCRRCPDSGEPRRGWLQLTITMRRPGVVRRRAYVEPIAAGRAPIAKASRASPRIVGRLGVWFGPRCPAYSRPDGAGAGSGLAACSSPRVLGCAAAAAELTALRARQRTEDRPAVGSGTRDFGAVATSADPGRSVRCPSGCSPWATGPAVRPEPFADLWPG
jgi:hypothetical protein